MREGYVGGGGVEAGEHQPGQLGAVDSGQRLVGRDRPLLAQIMGNAEGGLSGALADPRLQDPQPTPLDGEPR